MVGGGAINCNECAYCQYERYTLSRLNFLFFFTSSTAAPVSQPVCLPASGDMSVHVALICMVLQCEIERAQLMNTNNDATQLCASA